MYFVYFTQGVSKFINRMRFETVESAVAFIKAMPSDVTNVRLLDFKNGEFINV